MAKSLSELLHHFVESGSWFTEEERDEAHHAADEFDRLTAWLKKELRRVEKLIEELLTPGPVKSGSRINVTFGSPNPKP